MGWGCRSCGGDNPDGTRYCGHCGTATLEDAAAVDHQQRLITALFADISGFTTLADSLDADALHRVISPVIGLLAGIAERHGGTLAKYAGDAVLVFFGAPVAQEDHAQRALRCALDMHRELAEALPRLPEEGRSLELHVGVNSGRVVAGMFGGDIRTDYSILGDAVNVAQRLESVAPPGQTFVGRTTQELAAAEFALEPLGELTLKGKTSGVAAWRLDGVLAEVGIAATARLVGRDREVALLRALLDELVSTDRAERDVAIVVVVAEPGAGKSRLLEVLAADVRERGVSWLEGRSLSYGASLPYWPLVDLLHRSYGMSVAQDPELSAAKLAATPELEGVPLAVPVLGRLLGLPVPGLDEVAHLAPEAFLRELVLALTGWVRALAAQGPLVLLIEDLHWADSASVDLLGQVVRSVHDAPVLVVVTSRPEGAGAIDRLVGGQGVLHLPVGPLEPGATHQLVLDVLGAAPGTVDDDVLDLVQERTAGNPFFTHELVRALVATGVLQPRDGQWSLPAEYDATAIPPTVEGVLAARLDLLSRPAAALLQTASVIGRRVNLELLQAVTGDEVGLPGLIDQLVAAGMVDRAVEQGREVLSIHHGLVVDVAYNRLVQDQRRLLHRRVAEAAEVLYGAADDTLDLLARHLYLADAGVKAADHLERAAVRAQGLFANEQAVTHLQRAVELVRRSDRMAHRLPRLLLQAADLEELAGLHEEALRDYEEAFDLARDLRAVRGQAAVLRKAGHVEQALALLRATLEQPGDADDRTPLWLELVAALAYEGRSAEALDAAHQGLAGAPEDSPARAHLLLRLARAQETTGDFEQALSVALSAQQVFERLGDLRGLAFAHRVVGPLQAHLGHPEDAVLTLRRGLAMAERTGSAEEVGGCLINLGMAELSLGRPADGAAHDRRAIGLFEAAGNVAGEATAHANLAEKLGWCGEVESALQHGLRGRDLAAGIGAQWTLADAERTLGLLEAGRGGAEAARAHAAAAEEVFRSLDAPAQAQEAVTAVEQTIVGQALRGADVVGAASGPAPAT